MGRSKLDEFLDKVFKPVEDGEISLKDWLKGKELPAKDWITKGWLETKSTPLKKEIQEILHPEKTRLEEDMEELFGLNKGYKELPKDFYNSEEWAKKRIEILRRDNIKCIHCGNPANHVDHINSAYYFPQLALDSNNLISSCEGCHKKRQPRGKWK